MIQKSEGKRVSYLRCRSAIPKTKLELVAVLDEVHALLLEDLCNFCYLLRHVACRDQVFSKIRYKLVGLDEEISGRNGWEGWMEEKRGKRKEERTRGKKGSRK